MQKLSADLTLSLVPSGYHSDAINSIETCNYYQRFKTLTMYPTGTVSGSQLSRCVQNYQRI